MAGRVLVGYGSKRGSTREVAESIAAALREQGFEVDFGDAGDFKKPVGYLGVVIGGALYGGRWHSHARRLLKRLRRMAYPGGIAVFALGPRRDEPLAFERSRNQLRRELEKQKGIEPVAFAIFGGADAKKGIDIRDWDAIGAWAEEVGKAFGEVRPRLD